MCNGWHASLAFFWTTIVWRWAMPQLRNSYLAVSSSESMAAADVSRRDECPQGTRWLSTQLVQQARSWPVSESASFLRVQTNQMQLQPCQPLRVRVFPAKVGVMCCNPHFFSIFQNATAVTLLPHAYHPSLPHTTPFGGGENLCRLIQISPFIFTWPAFAPFPRLKTHPVPFRSNVPLAVGL